ncbi:hypothetical protein JRQ81_010201 [Phrynocephalus forsythii]|uniref:THUMP domain-containing protein 1 n=1 Tax=Phrynocephalus forsythii TaxID=171643 RepID=A0A9Q0X840_9SAUR|nr:hypothetical protein JRQ81_010201 [Phrynocephalus forsythii]
MPEECFSATCPCKVQSAQKAPPPPRNGGPHGDGGGGSFFPQAAAQSPLLGGRQAEPAGVGASRQLDLGMSGILITCNMNERKCVAEAYSLLGEYGERLYGPEQFTGQDEDKSSGKEEEEEEEEDDAEAALKKEVNQIHAMTEQRQRRFQSVESGANNVIFIRTLGVEPDKLVHHILNDMHVTKKKKNRVILRMLPILGTCKAFMEDMKRYSETFFEPWFKSPQKGTFQIVYKARNNSHLNRVSVINELAGVVSHLNPENKVDLSNPEFTIVVEVIKNICCLSVVKDYVLFRKYNLQEVVKGSKEDRPEDASTVSPDARVERGKSAPEKDEPEDEAEGEANDNHVD